MTRRLLALLLAPVLWLTGSAAVAATGHHLTLRLDPAAGEIGVQTEIGLSGLDGYTFRLSPGLRIVEARLDGALVEPTGGGGLWHVPLPDRGDHRLALSYRGALGLGDADEGGPPGPFLGPSGAFLTAGSGWLPRDGLALPVDRLTVEVPAPYLAVATGRLVHEETRDGLERAVFTAEGSGEPPVVFAGRFTVHERRHDGILLRTYFDRDMPGLAEAYLEQTARYIDRFQAEIGPYPFAGFHIVAGPLPVGYGFPGLTYVSRRILPLPFMRTRSLAHEVLHNWWGNGVLTDYASGNWAEGLTTYMADYALAEDKGPAVARDRRLGWLRDFAALPPERDRPLRDFVSKTQDAAQIVGYGKAAFLFHMLKRRISADAFRAALQQFWRDHRFETAGWDDLRDAFARASGTDLDVFFAQWLERGGAPTLELGEVAVSADRRRITVSLRQADPAYQLEVPLRVETDAGAVDVSLTLEGPAAIAVLDSPAPPRRLRVDPDAHVFRRLAPGEAPPILRDVTLDGDTRLVLASGPDGVVADTAESLAARLMDTRPPTTATRPPDDAPLLLVGLTPQVARRLAELALPPVPASLDGRGSARVWTARRGGGDALLVIAADDAEALAALQRPLPHYGRKSWLVFEGRRAIDSGIWPPGDSPLTRRLD